MKDCYTYNHISVEKWKQILTSDKYCSTAIKKIVEFVYRSSNHRSHASKIAKWLSYEDKAPVNSIVGKWGHALQKHFGLTIPSRRVNGTVRWWNIVFDGEDCVNDVPSHFDWMIKPEMLEAIQTLHLFEGNVISTELQEEIRRAVRDAQNEMPLKGMEKVYLSKCRVNQGKIRQVAMQHYGCKCHLCGLGVPSLLVVSHIVPWSKSTEEEKADIDNLLLLCVQHDALFDKHLISFDENGGILIYDNLDEAARKLLNINSGMKVDVSPKMKTYMDVHRKEFEENLHGGIKRI